MKKHIIFILLFSIFFLKAYTQNMVPDYSFESDTSCPYQPGQIYLLDSGWFEYGTVDYFNACDTSNFYGIPLNRIGFQNSHSGNGYVGLYGYYSTAFSREYIEIQLASPLLASQLYYVSFYVSMGDTMQYSIENLGALFTDTLFDPFPAPSFNWQTGIPQVENPAGNMLNDKINWTEISGSFIAAGGEKYITIGNFKNDTQTVTQYFGGTTINTLGAYYYIDDIYVGTTPVGIVEKNHIDYFKLYPNPNNGSMTLEYSLKEGESGIVNIYSLAGKLFDTYKLNNNTSKMAIDALLLEEGLYMYEVLINNKKVKTDKLVIIK